MNDDLISWKAVIEENVDKVRVSSAEIVVHGTKENPYYEIEYFDLSDNEIHIGFSSYKLDVVFGNLEKYFDIVNEENKSDQVQDYHSDDLISRKALIAELEKFCSKQRYLIPENVWELIKTAYTAFDKEKVMDELQNAADLNIGDGLWHVELRDALEIVEKGGIE